MFITIPIIPDLDLDEVGVKLDAVDCDINPYEIEFFYDEDDRTAIHFKSGHEIVSTLRINEFRNLLKPYNYGLFKAGN